MSGDRGEEQFRQLLDAVPDAMLIVDQRGVILLANALAGRMFGYAAGELLGQPIELLIPERFHSGHRHLRSEYSSAPRVRPMGVGVELVGLRNDGSEFPAEISLGPLHTGEGLLVFTAIRDVTARRQAQQDVENNLRIQSAVGGILRLCLEPISLDEVLQRSLDAIFSVPGLALQGVGAIFLVDEEPGVLVMKAQRGLPPTLQAACAKLPVGRCLCGRASSTRDIVFVDRLAEGHENAHPELPDHGHYCIPIVSEGDLCGAVNLYVEAGHRRRPEGDRFLTAVADALAGTIQRRRAELALRTSEERFALAARGTDAGIWDWDLVTNRVYFSARWKSLLGYGEHELGDDFGVWESHLHPDDRERSLATVRAYLEGRSADYELEHRLRHKNGSYRWILARGAALFDPRGKPYRMVGWHLDVTERKQAEATLQHQQAQLLAAQTIQQYLLPSGPPQVPGLEIAGASYPADFAAGDHFDYLTLPDGTLGFVVGDVSGHGFAAALFMAAVHARLRALAETNIGLDEILTRANAALINESGPGTFVTVFFGCLNLQTRTFVYASAGHPTGYLMDAAGHVKAHLKSTALPLAVVADAEFPMAPPIAVQPGDTLLLLTDGVLESQAADGEYFGADRTLQVVRENRTQTAQEILDRLCRAVCQFAEGERPQDDVTAVVIKVQ